MDDVAQREETYGGCIDQGPSQNHIRPHFCEAVGSGDTQHTTLFMPFGSERCRVLPAQMQYISFLTEGDAGQPTAYICAVWVVNAQDDLLSP